MSETKISHNPIDLWVGCLESFLLYAETVIKSIVVNNAK